VIALLICLNSGPESSISLGSSLLPASVAGQPAFPLMKS